MGSFKIVKLQNPISLGLTLTAEGAYDNDTAYSAGDSVSYNGSSYVAIQSTTGNLPTDTTYWQLLAEKGETGEQGEQGIQGVQGEAGTNGTNGTNGTDGADGVVQAVVAGDGIEVDDTDPANPEVSVSSTTSKGFVNHGSTAGTARPAGYASVTWLGTVEPSNAINNDEWIDPS